MLCCGRSCLAVNFPKIYRCIAEFFLICGSFLWSLGFVVVGWYFWLICELSCCCEWLWVVVVGLGCGCSCSCSD